MRRRLVLLLALMAPAASPALADFTLLDDFNRPDAPTLGPGWTLRSGSFGVAGGMAVAGGQGIGLATFDGAVSAVVTADFHAAPGSAGIAALVLGYSDPANCLEIGFASNVDGYFDATVLHFGIDGSNDAAWPNAGILHNFPPLTPFRDARITVTLLIDGLIRIAIDTDFDGRLNLGVNTGRIPVDLLGLGIGIAAQGGGRVDNFGVGTPIVVPEPASIVLASIGGLALAAMRAARRFIVSFEGSRRPPGPRTVAIMAFADPSPGPRSLASGCNRGPRPGTRLWVHFGRLRPVPDRSRSVAHCRNSGRTTCHCAKQGSVCRSTRTRWAACSLASSS